MFYWIVRPLLKLFYKLIYPTKVFGLENVVQDGKRIVICNHLGKMDVFVVGALFKNKTYFLSKIEWWDNKLLGWVISKLGAIPLDRDKPSISTIKNAFKVLKDEKRLGIFPEGRRNFDTNDLQEIKHGTSMFAFKGQAPITAVIINDKLKPFRKNYAIVGKSFDFSEFYEQKYTDEVSDKCTEIIANNMKELQIELAKLVEEEKSKKKSKKKK